MSDTGAARVVAANLPHMNMTVMDLQTIRLEQAKGNHIQSDGCMLNGVPIEVPQAIGKQVDNVWIELRAEFTTPPSSPVFDRPCPVSTKAQCALHAPPYWRSVGEVDRTFFT